MKMKMSQYQMKHSFSIRHGIFDICRDLWQRKIWVRDVASNCYHNYICRGCMMVFLLTLYLGPRWSTFNGGLPLLALPSFRVVFIDKDGIFTREPHSLKLQSAPHRLFCWKFHGNVLHSLATNILNCNWRGHGMHGNIPYLTEKARIVTGSHWLVLTKYGNMSQSSYVSQ